MNYAIDIVVFLLRYIYVKDDDDAEDDDDDFALYTYSYQYFIHTGTYVYVNMYSITMRDNNEDVVTAIRCDHIDIIYILILSLSFYNNILLLQIVKKLAV